jgi:hypothetical protein
MIKEIFKLIFGDIALTMLIALYFFAIIGVALNLLYNANRRDQESLDTPVKYSSWFLIKDNRRRLYMDVICLFISIRFLPLIITIDITKQELWLFGAFIVGFGFDKLFERLKAIEGSFLKVKRAIQVEKVKDQIKEEIMDDIIIKKNGTVLS